MILIKFVLYVLGIFGTTRMKDLPVARKEILYYLCLYSSTQKIVRYPLNIFFLITSKPSVYILNLNGVELELFF